MKNRLSKLFNHNDQDETAVAQEAEQAQEQERVQEIAVSSITPNQYQPRSIFDEEKLHELAATIDEHGIIQPIIVRPLDDRYEIIAGERRWRAVSYLGWETIPSIIKPLSDDQSASIALIENLQREELTAIEEAAAYARLIEINGLTQEGLAEKLGRGQSTIANKLRLLKLPASVQNAILEKKISERHARALIALKDPELQEKMLQELITKQLNVKQTEKRVKQYLQKKEDKKDTEGKKARRRALSRDSRIAVNTIRQSVHMVTDSGLDIDTHEEDMGDFYQFTIRIPKKK
ncbi:nucleoid occlusion protein [Sporolactobacillus inulinus]|uniref:Chromosome (Plasmid) partitioning protein ParB n=2 Tax=Sporolactobacillus inulinus TaxID=2078 RepID=A0A4Y1ZFF9_9BACL|nr:nucleoid occlusion protein [Sporolactobacillus inulinus]KLI03776.1 chromosome partitioning protein ParB [Sporolactobacillus inulinus CASD]GAY77208.1 chromosome (plasmid) partitioning protein ParB [Sporolactobacillus inulinus]GEB77522.1 nucleoid occlusion protein [Sporolactobacillus inulinus]